jgi:hypothetical protein
LVATPVVILLLAWASLLAVFLAFGLGLSRVASHADHSAGRAWRALLLSRLARRRGDRRQDDRRRRTAPIAHERRDAERRLAERRAEPVTVDPPTADRGLELVGLDQTVP